MRFTAAGAGSDKKRSTSVVSGFRLPIVHIFARICSIHSLLKQLSFARNKTVITAFFLCAVSLANASFGASTALAPHDSKVMGGPSLDSSSSATFLGDSSILEDTTFFSNESVLHNALAESSGQSVSASLGTNAEDFVRRFSLPAHGINWGALHPHNAVDVAGACGSGVYATAAGQVVDARNGWDGGYGNYVDIDHGNGVITRYAHAEEVLVKVGQMVAGGDMVARMGNTGNSTGCHVHFEVLGTTGVKNPFAKN